MPDLTELIVKMQEQLARQNGILSAVEQQKLINAHNFSMLQEEFRQMKEELIKLQEAV